MKTIEGAYTSARIFTCDNETISIDPYALAQIKMICDQEAVRGCRISVMPDVHPGKIGPIGLTMTTGEKILPGLIGIDIGCGMSLIEIKNRKIEYQKLDSVIRERIPSGFSIRSKAHPLAETFDFSALRCAAHIRRDKAALSLGTLGGGNHFIECGKNGSGHLFAVIHSGSRHLGKEVAEYYLKEGQKQLQANGIIVPYELTWLEGALKEDYLHDLQIVQRFASLNREVMMAELTRSMKWKVLDSWECVHNYVDTRPETLALFHSPMLRKGAISALSGEKVIIPANMRDGILLGTGLGNIEWNASAPHGSGRILKREDVKNQFTVSSFKAEMKGIYTSCIGKDTLDEAPFAYRKISDITKAIGDTVDITDVLTPVYNFKAGGR